MGNEPCKSKNPGSNYVKRRAEKYRTKLIEMSLDVGMSDLILIASPDISSPATCQGTGCNTARGKCLCYSQHCLLLGGSLGYLGRFHHSTGISLGTNRDSLEGVSDSGLLAPW